MAENYFFFTLKEALYMPNATSDIIWIIMIICFATWLCINCKSYFNYWLLILCLKFVEQFTYPFSWWICNFVILQERKCMYKLLGNNCSLILSGVPCLNWNKGTDIPYQFISLGGMKYFQLYSRFQINWKLEKHNKEKLLG